MLTLLILAPIFAVILVVHLIKRILFGSGWHHRHHRRYGCGYGNYGGGFYPRSRYGFGGFGGFLPILVLVALERLFDRRY